MGGKASWRVKPGKSGWRFLLLPIGSGIPVTPNSNASFHAASLFSSRALSFAVCERPENYVLTFAVRISRDI